MGFGEVLAKLLLRKKEDEDVEQKKAALEEMNKALPTAVSARPAVLKKREQMKQLDKVLEEK